MCNVAWRVRYLSHPPHWRKEWAVKQVDWAAVLQVSECLYYSHSSLGRISHQRYVYDCKRHISSTTYQNRIVTSTCIIKHSSHLVFWYGHKRNILVVNESSCPMNVIYPSTRWRIESILFIIATGRPVEMNILHTLFLCLFDSLYCGGWNLMWLEGY